MFEELENIMQKMSEKQKFKESVIVLTEEQFALLKKEVNPGIQPTPEELLKGIRVNVVSVDKYAETVFQLGQTKNVIIWSTKDED